MKSAWLMKMGKMLCSLWGMIIRLNGIEATRQITDKFPSVKVIALSMHANKLFVMDMFKAGASGYLLKECASSELTTAINTVLAGDVYLSPKVAGVVLEAHLKSPSILRSSTARLTTLDY